MIAPILGGTLLISSPSMLVYASAFILVFAGLCTVTLRYEAPAQPIH